MILQDILISSSFDNVGTLFGSSSSIMVSNITCQGTIVGNSNTQNYGGLVGSSTQSVFENCHVKTKIIASSSKNLGGLTGSGVSTNFTNCYNLGVNNDPNEIIISGSEAIGGISGSAVTCVFKNSGVHYGIIQGTTQNAGGIAGYSEGFFHFLFLLLIFLKLK